MKCQKKPLRALWMVVLCFALTPATSYAETAEAAETVPDSFSVRAILPGNQIEGHAYFAMVTAPASSQVIEVEVTNDFDEPLPLWVKVTDAASSASGVIVYKTEEAPQNILSLPDILTFDFAAQEVDEDASILEAEADFVLIAPHSVVRLPFRLAMPDISIDGQLLGGIVLTKGEPEIETDAAFAIQSLFSYTIAVQLQTEEMLAYPPDFAVGTPQVTAVAGFPALTIPIENRTPVVISGAQLTFTIAATASDETLFEQQNIRVSLVPYSTMPYTVTLMEKNGLPEGTYDLRLTLTYQEETHSFAVQFHVPENES